jgi:hypothetical protein
MQAKEMADGIVILFVARTHYEASSEEVGTVISVRAATVFERVAMKIGDEASEDLGRRSDALTSTTLRNE